jgi:YD repeat-containing protein
VNPDSLGETWDEGDFGLPFTLGTGRLHDLHSAIRRDPTDNTKKQYLSWELYAPDGHRLQSRYVVYERDPNSQPDRGNARVIASTAYFEDAACASSDCLPAHTVQNCTLTNCDPSNFASSHNHEYRQYGNYGCAVTSGKDIDGTRRDRTLCRDFAASLPTGNVWVLDDPASECSVSGYVQTVAACQSAAGAFITRLNYDRPHNLLLGKRVLGGVSSGGGAVLGANDLLTTYAYSSNGNLTEEAYAGGDCPPVEAANCGGLPTTDANTFPSSPTARYRVTYDNQYDGYGALKRVIAKYSGFNFTNADFAIDTASGAVTDSRDSDGLLTHYDYDKISRLVRVSSPGGATNRYDYNDGARPVAIAVTTAAPDGNSIHNSYDYNGLGLLWHERMKVGDADSTRTTLYDSMLHVTKTSPFLATATECPDTNPVCTNATYDLLGRPTSSTNADQYTTTYEYTAPWETKRSVPLTRNASDAKAVTTERIDALGRLVYVKDPVETIGQYGYDVADRLASVTVTDLNNHQQPRTFTYDRRGFLTSESHPENGTASYTYDVRGHVLTKALAVADGFDLLYQYDAAERLIHLKSRPSQTTGDYAQTVKDFVFADAATDSAVDGRTDHARGKLQQATRHNRQKLSPPAVSDVKVVETYHYRDDAGRLTDRDTQVYVDDATTPLQSLHQSTDYNGLGLVQKTLYPGCTNSYPQCGGATWGAINRMYAEGRPTSILGIAGFDYAANGMIRTIAHTNGVTDTITPWDNGLPRPKSIKFEGESACLTPVITTQPADQHVVAGAKATFSVQASGTGPLTVQWYYGANGNPVSGATDWTFTTDTLSQTATYYAKVTGTCSGTNTTVQSSTVSALVETCPAPAAPTVSADVTIGYLQKTTLTAGASGDGLTYEWYREDDGTVLQSSTNPNYTTTDPVNLGSGLLKTTRFRVRVMKNCSGTAVWSPFSEFVTVHVIPAPPSNLTAVVSGSTITLSWTPSPSTSTTGAVDHQELDVMFSNGQWQTNIVQSPTQGSSVQTGFSSGAARAYRVRAISGNPENLPSGYSNVVVAVVMSFTQITGGAAAPAAPLNELLTAINAVRAIGPGGLGALTWSGILPAGVAAPAQLVTIQAAHINALRTAMDAALSSVGVIPRSYTDPGLPPDTPSRSVHITELRSRVQQ